MKNVKELIELLTKKNQSLATMESCTGGGLANAITDISGASSVFNYGYVTYSNEAKIDIGVNPKTIEKFTVYSKEVAREMAITASLRSKSTFGVGITGQIGQMDPNNKGVKINIVFVAIYDSVLKETTNLEIELNENDSRTQSKLRIINETIERLIQKLI